MLTCYYCKEPLHAPEELETGICDPCGVALYYARRDQLDAARQRAEETGCEFDPALLGDPLERPEDR